MSYEPAQPSQPPMGMKDTSGQDRLVTTKNRFPWKWIVGGVALVAVLALLMPVVSRWQSTEKSLHAVE